MPRILHIEADEDVRFLVGRLLTDAGHEVVPAATAWDALRLLQGSEWRPDAVFLDALLPEVSGWDLLAWIRAQPAFAALPVVLSTVRDDDSSRARARALGCAGFVAKPFDVRDLVAAVEDVVSQYA